MCCTEYITSFLFFQERDIYFASETSRQFYFMTKGRVINFHIHNLLSPILLLLSYKSTFITISMTSLFEWFAHRISWYNHLWSSGINHEPTEWKKLIFLYCFGSGCLWYRRFFRFPWPRWCSYLLWGQSNILVKIDVANVV